MMTWRRQRMTICLLSCSDPVYFWFLAPNRRRWNRHWMLLPTLQCNSTFIHTHTRSTAPPSPGRLDLAGLKRLSLGGRNGRTGLDKKERGLFKSVYMYNAFLCLGFQGFLLRWVIARKGWMLSHRDEFCIMESYDVMRRCEMESLPIMDRGLYFCFPCLYT